jgi:hypothetical protein
MTTKKLLYVYLNDADPLGLCMKMPNEPITNRMLYYILKRKRLASKRKGNSKEKIS